MESGLFLWFLPSLEVIWLLSWLYLSALGGSGGWVSLSSKPSRLLLDYTKDRRQTQSVTEGFRGGKPAHGN